jgi:hypothetical protein
MANDAIHWTHQEFDLDWLEDAGCDANGELLVFDSYEAAVDMAKCRLESIATPHNIAAWATAEGILPVIGILGHDHDPSNDPDAEGESWSFGCVVNVDGTPAVRAETACEEDAFVWDRMPASANRVS